MLLLTDDVNVILFSIALLKPRAAVQDRARGCAKRSNDLHAIHGMRKGHVLVQRALVHLKHAAPQELVRGASVPKYPRQACQNRLRTHTCTDWQPIGKCSLGGKHNPWNPPLNLQSCNHPIGTRAVVQPSHWYTGSRTTIPLVHVFGARGD